MISTCTVRTPNAARYLKALCRHWAHHLPVEQSDTHGRVEFPVALGLFTVESDTLTLRLEGPEEVFDRMEAGVGDHLRRFAFREPDLVIAWTRTPAA